MAGFDPLSPIRDPLSGDLLVFSPAPTPSLTSYIPSRTSINHPALMTCTLFMATSKLTKFSAWRHSGSGRDIHRSCRRLMNLLAEPPSRGDKAQRKWEGLSCLIKASMGKVHSPLSLFSYVVFRWYLLAEFLWHAWVLKEISEGFYEIKTCLRCPRWRFLGINLFGNKMGFRIFYMHLLMLYLF